MHKLSLNIFVLILGVNIMALEMIALRLMTFQFGGGVTTTALVVAVVLVALTLGALYSSKYKEVDKSLNRFFIFLRFASFYILLTNLCFRDSIMNYVGTLQLDLFFEELFLTILLFSFPSFVFGQTVPLVISFDSIKLGVQKSASKIIVISTIGSVIGTLFTPYYLLPVLGEDYSILLISVSIILATYIVSRKKIDLILLFVFCLIGFFFIKGQSVDQNKFVINTKLNRILVEKNDGKFKLSTSYSRADTYVDINNILKNVWALTYLSPALTIKPKSILILGSAGGVNLLQIKQVFPDSEITAVEIDEGIVKISSEYIGKSITENVDTHFVDARLFLQRVKTKYDYIIVDIYKNASVPEQCVTKEFYQLVHDRLTPNGIVNINTNVSEFYFSSFASDDLRSIRKLKSTLFAAGFKNQFYNKVAVQLFASKDSKMINLELLRSDEFLKNFPPEMQTIAKASYFMTYHVPKEHYTAEVLTDNYGLNYNFSDYRNVLKLIKEFNKIGTDEYMKISETMYTDRFNRKNVNYLQSWKTQGEFFNRQDQLKYFVEDSENYYDKVEEKNLGFNTLIQYNNLLHSFRRGHFERIENAVTYLNKSSKISL